MRATSIGVRPTYELVSKMLTKLTKVLPQGTNPIIHSDQGFHYQLKTYQGYLNEHGYKQSMSRKENCLDNASIESYFGFAKRECLHHVALDSIGTLTKVYEEYAEWFNKERVSGSKKGLTPHEYQCESLKV